MNKNNRMSKRLLNYVIVLLVCLISSAESFAQGTKFQVKGNVTDASREPIVGATIKVKGTSQGVITNIDGEYSIDTRSNAILEFSYIGYVSQEVPVSGSKIINVTLQEEVSKLDEVVVVGYGTQKKISVTGSVSNVSTKEIAKIATPSLSNTLGGQIPGIVTRQATGEPGYDQASIYIRGFGTWTNRSPLILVDGIERDMNTINTEEVESISVLKDASATAVYGVRGANGVILITTKRGQLGKPKVTLRSEYAVLTGLRYPEYINAAEYAGLMNEARDNAGVAKVDQKGVITPVSVGETDIRVKTDQNVTAVCHVVVKGTAKDLFAAGMPTVKACKASGNTVMITWDKYDAADSYLILRRKMGESRFTQIAETKELTYTDARTVGDTLYYYSVQAVSGKWGNAVRSSYDKNISVKTQTTTPQPTPGQTVKLKTPAVTVTAGKKQAKLKWKKISNAQGYVVYRATSKNGKYKAVSTIKKGSTVSYTNKKLTSKKTYYYKVRAYRVVNGKKVYSGYSKVKGVKIK